jgi:hypothetical protein
MRGGVAGAVVVHAAGNAADGLFPAASTAGALVATAVAAGIALALYALYQRGGRARAK